MKAPFPYFGGKARTASEVWTRLGPDVAAYCEPFAGSAAMLLARPGWHREVKWTETINDADGMVANFWRAIRYEPELTAYYADWPVNENDLHARHAWLVARKDSLRARLEGDPDYFDAKVAGWWCWGMSCWIGRGFCAGNGAWLVDDGELIRSTDGRGIQRQRVHLSTAGQGIQRQRVHLSTAGQGAEGDGAAGLYAWFEALAARLQRVRVCCGDWRRVMTPAARGSAYKDVVALFFDPPYSAEAGRADGLYASDDLVVAHAVADWCEANGDDAGLRIALCGYAGEGHERLEGLGWSVAGRSEQGGYANANPNRHRERIWFSPHCLTPAQGSLFEGAS